MAGWGRMCYRPQSAAQRLSVCVGSPPQSFRDTISVALRSVFILFFSLSLSYLSLSVSPRSLPPFPCSPFATRSSLCLSPPSTEFHPVGSNHDFLRTRRVLDSRRSPRSVLCVSVRSVFDDRKVRAKHGRISEVRAFFFLRRRARAGACVCMYVVWVYAYVRVCGVCACVCVCVFARVRVRNETCVTHCRFIAAPRMRNRARIYEGSRGEAAWRFLDVVFVRAR